MLRRSQEFTASDRRKFAVTVTGGHAAPDGSATASLVTQTSAGGLHRVYQPWSPVGGQPHSVSVWLKDAGARYLYINTSANLGAGFCVDLQSGATAVSGAAVQDASVVTYPDGWRRVSYRGTGNGGASNGTWLQLNDSFVASDRGFVGDGTSGVLVWGAQVEVGDRPTSHVRTAGTPAERAADQPAVLGLSGVHDVVLTYDDMTSETLATTTISEGWWPGLARPRLRSMVIA